MRTLTITLRLLVLAVLLLPPAALATSFSGKVVKVLDGDTIDVLHNNKPERIRLNGIDAPEKAQAYGQKSKEFVLDLAALKLVTVTVSAIDRYGRSIGEVILPDGRNLNRELVRFGYAWWYRQYSHDATLGALEDEARAAHRGLWQDREPMAPWAWRKAKRGGPR